MYGIAFCQCTELLFVDISKIKISILNSTFYGCGKLKYVFLPKDNFEIKTYSFYGCYNLKLVTNIENCLQYHTLNNFNNSTNLLYFSTKDIKMSKNNLKCKYFDVSNNFHENFYPTIPPLSTNKPYIIITKPENFIKYIADGYKGNFLMSQENKKTLLEKENKIIEEQKKQKEDEKKKEEDKKDEKKDEIKKEKKTPWEKGIVNKHIVAFKDFVFDDFNIVKNENEEEVKTVDQIFYKFVQDEIKDMDDFLRKNMEDWNNLKKEEKTYEKFKNVFVSDYERKNLFVPDWKVPENNEININ